MQASRILMSSTTAKGFHVPPRTSWDVIKSAGSACVSILSNQATRDNFLATLENGIIKSHVLGQAEMGSAMILALFNELNSPLFKKYDFQIEDFAVGVKPALENFHNARFSLQYQLRNETHANAARMGVEKESIERGKCDNFGASQTKQAIDNIVVDLTQKAIEEPDSLAGQLKAMVTSEYLKCIEDNNKFFILNDNNQLDYVEGSSEIANMALLSARAMVVDSMVASKYGKEGNLLGDEDRHGISNLACTKNPPVVAQIEVLYDINATFAHKSEVADTSTDIKGGQDGNSLLVGVFEGWLHGDPSGESELRWKLCGNRISWEFPSLITLAY